MISQTVVASVVLAHGAGSVDEWTFDVWVTGPLVIAIVLFAVGLVRLRLRSHNASPSYRQAALFIAGWAVLAGALVSPLHRAGERSFAMHMLEHELLMLVAAPLLVAARVQGIMLWAFPRRLRLALATFFSTRGVTGLWRTLTDPVIATALQAAALWLWHAPPLFDLALGSAGWHIAQHLTFLIAALFFWSAMFNARQNHRRPMAIVGCLFVTALVSGALGALMAFSGSPWYAAYRTLQFGAFGLTAAQDQQVAGLLMWIPGGLVHLVFALALLARALRGTAPCDGRVQRSTQCPQAHEADPRGPGSVIVP